MVAIPLLLIVVALAPCAASENIDASTLGFCGVQGKKKPPDKAVS